MSKYGIGQMYWTNIGRLCARLFAYNVELIFKNYRENKHNTQEIETMSIKCKKIIYTRYSKIYTDGSADNPQTP